MSFTAQEQAQVLKHLGFADWQALAQSIQLGFPASSQPLFLVRDAFNRLTRDGEDAAREALCNCQAIYAQLADARSRFKVMAVGEVRMRGAPGEASETTLLRNEYSFWTARLADALGVSPNAYSNLGSLGSGLNRPVIG